MEGYAERPTTPCSIVTVPSPVSSSPEPSPIMQRAATWVPVLDFDQSRVSTPVSPFKIDQSRRLAHSASAGCLKSAEFDFHHKPNVRFRREKTSLDLSDHQRTKMTSQTLKSKLLKSKNKPSTDSTNVNFAVTGKSHISESLQPAKLKLAICSVMDIQAAIQELALNLGVNKNMLKTSVE